MTSVAGEYSNVEYVFEPHSVVLPDLKQYAASLWERRSFMTALARAELRSARTSTRCGNLWGVLDPLFQAGIYFFLYTVLRKGAADRVQFLPVLIGGFFLYSLTAAALGEAGASIKRSRGLMLNSTFPRALLPVTSVYKSLRKFAPSVFVFIIIFPLLGGRVGTGAFVFPLLFACQVVMNVGIALLVSTFVTLLPDAGLAMNYVNRVIMFATPVIYPVSLLPPGPRRLVSWQPLFPLYASYQTIFTGGVPSPGLVLQTIVSTVAIFAIGGWFFLRHEREFAIHL